MFIGKLEPLELLAGCAMLSLYFLRGMIQSRKVFGAGGWLGVVRLRGGQLRPDRKLSRRPLSNWR